MLDLLGLTDRHNATHGSAWARRFGRTDYAYSFAQPFDLLITNVWWDLAELVTYHERQPDPNSLPVIYLQPNYLQPNWLQRRFYVVTRSDHPIAAALQEACACTPTPLSHDVVTRIKQSTSP